MENLKEILNKIYLYYPKRLSFDSPQYQSSKEYLRLLKKRDKACKNAEHQKYLKYTLKNVFKNYEIVDWTELESYNCYEYRILLHNNQSILDDDIDLIKALGNKRLDLFLFISVLEKYYYILTNYTEFYPETGKWSFETYHGFPDGFEDEMNHLNQFLLSKNYAQLSKEIAKEITVDIETELKSLGNANIFSCFFTDLITI